MRRSLQGMALCLVGLVLASKFEQILVVFSIGLGLCMSWFVIAVVSALIQRSRPAKEERLQPEPAAVLEFREQHLSAGEVLITYCRVRQEFELEKPYFGYLILTDQRVCHVLDHSRGQIDDTIPLASLSSVECAHANLYNGLTLEMPGHSFTVVGNGDATTLMESIELYRLKAVGHAGHVP